MTMRLLVVSVLVLVLGSPSATAWVSSTPQTKQARTQLSAQSRSDFLQTVVKTSAGLALGGLVSFQTPSAARAASTETLANGVSYTVLKSGDGPKPEKGELVAIRFAAYNGEIKIDDIFDTPEPYYTRLGSGGLIKGVEETLPLMRLGDRWKLTIPGNMAFGSKGRPASAGKPRIPANAEIVFEVEMVGLPGKEPELIELIGDV